MRNQKLRRNTLASALILVGLLSGAVAEEGPAKPALPAEWQFVQHFAEEPFLSVFLELNGPYGHAFLDGANAVGKTGAAVQLQGALWYGVKAEEGIDRAMLYGQVARGLENPLLVHLNKLGAAVGNVEENTQPGVNEARAGGKTVLTYSVKDGNVALGTPKEFTQRSQTKPRLEAAPVPPWFDALRPHLGQPTHDGLTLRSVFDLTRIPPGAMPGPDWTGAARTLGLDGLEMRGAAALTVDLKRLELTVTAPHKGEPRGLAALLFPQPEDLKLDERLPEETVLMAHFSGPLLHAVEALGALERTLDAEAAEEFERELTALDRDLGFGFRQELLSLFPHGGVFALCLPPAGTVVPTKEGAPTSYPCWLALLPCEKPEIATELMDRWLKYAGVTPELKTVQGVETRDLGEQCLVRCAYAFVNGVLYVGESPQIIGLAVEALRTGKTLAATRPFQEFRRTRPDWGFSLFFNGPSVAQWARAVMAYWPPSRAKDKAELQEAEKRLAVIEQLGQVWIDSACRDGLAVTRLEWIGENPLHGLAQACAKLLPILTRARREAQRANSINSAEALGRCFRMYADDHKDQLPERMEQLVEKYVKDPGLFRSPKTQAPSPKDAEAAARESSYCLCFPGRELGELKHDLVLLYEKPWFDDEGTVVCYVDGRTEYVPKERLLELLEKVRAAHGKP